MIVIGMLKENRLLTLSKQNGKDCVLLAFSTELTF